MRLILTISLMGVPLLTACDGGKSDDPDAGSSTTDDTDDTVTDDTVTDDTGPTGPADADGDGYDETEDCDDTDAAISPAADEVCDDVDNNCDGTIDEDTAADALAWYADADADDWGDPAVITLACESPEGESPRWVADNTDCDDADAGLNNDDVDADGFTTCESDCDDDLLTGSSAYPGADEICDEADNDCDAIVDEESIDAATWYADTDEDSFGDVDAPLNACDQPDGYLSDATDCDDTDSAVNTDAVEVCDGVDNDCDADVDDADESVDYTGEPAVYPDLDADGYGDLTADAEQICEVPGDYVEDNTDCDDTDGAINPGASDDEVYYDGVDQDCDGFDGYTVEDLGEGDLVITEVMNNPSAVNDYEGEWFEVYNALDDSVDLNGLAIYDDGFDGFTVSGPLVVEAGEYVIFGVNDDAATNGGVSINYDWGSISTMGLGNSNDELYLANASLVIDRVRWNGSTNWLDLDGVAMGLDPDRMTATDNDYGGSWCEAVEPYGDGDLGTPGAINVCACVEVAYELIAQDHTIVNYSTGMISPSVDLAAYDSGADFDAAGWLSFNLGIIDDDAEILDATLNLVEDLSWPEYGSPEIVVIYSDGDDWGGSDVSDAADIPRTATVSEVFSAFTLNDWNSFEVDVTAWDWALDLTDGALTLGVDSIRDGEYSYIFFYGSDRGDDSAYLELTVCE